MRAARGIKAAALALALGAACGGGQTQGLAFDPRWANDGGVGIGEFQQQFAATPVPRGADIAVGIAGEGAAAMLIGAPLDGGATWTFSHALDARPTVVGSVVVALGGGELFALDARTGRLLWKRYVGGQLRGAGDDGKTTVVSLVSTTGQVSALLAISHEGEVLRQIEDPQAIGVPAVVGRYAFLPWQGQYVTVFDLQTGDEVARALLRTEVSRAFTLGGAVFFGGAGATRLDERIRLGSKGQASTVVPPPRELPGAPRWMTPGTEVLDAGTSARDKIRLYGRPTASGPAGIDAGRFAATYFRIAVGLDARSGKVAWAHAGGADFLGGAAYAGGFALCDASGRVTLLEATRGAVAGGVSLGRPIDACVVQADGLAAPPRAAPDAAPEPLPKQLERVVTMPEAELMAIQRVLLGELAALPDEGVTGALIEVAGDVRTPPLLLGDAREALAARRTGASYMLQALGRRYDYLSGNLRPPPVGPLAAALAAMNERRAAPLLARHLNDPETPAGDLQRVAAALVVLAGTGELPALRTFFALYRGVADAALEGAVVSAAEGLVKVGGAELVARAAADPFTTPAIKARLAALAARQSGAAAPAPSPAAAARK